jgi:hypothetical protein
MSAPSFFMATIISTVGGLKWAEQMDLPAFPLMTLLLGLLIGIITYFREQKTKITIFIHTPKSEETESFLFMVFLLGK